MKKLILLTLLTLLVSAHKAKAWCVLCYHPHNGATEQLIAENNHHIVSDEVKTVYEHNRKMTAKVRVMPDNGYDDPIDLDADTVHLFKKTEHGNNHHYLIDGTRITGASYDTAEINSNECD